MKPRSLYIIIILIFFLNHSFFAKETNNYLKFDDRVVELVGDWIFVPLDITQIENNIVFYDNPVETWQYNIPELSSYEGLGLYKYLFSLESIVINNKIAISLPLCYSGYQLFFNGKKLYETSLFNEDIPVFGNIPIIIEIPEYLLTRNNTITLRVTSKNGWGGFGSNGIEKPYIKIGPYDQIISNWARFIIEYTAIGFISIFLFVFFLIRYSQRIQDKYNLHFALFSLSVGVFTMGFYGFWYYFYYQSWAYWLLTFLGGINMYLMPIFFFHSFFNLKKKLVAKIFIFFYAIMNFLVLGEYLFTGQLSFFIKNIYIYFNISYIFLVGYLLVLGIKAIIAKLEYARVMFIGTFLLLITFIYSMLTFIGIIKYTPLIGEGFFLMVLVFSFVLAKRFAGTHQKLEVVHEGLIVATEEIKALNHNLEDKVRKRTIELKEKNTQITESIEYASLIQNSVQTSQEELAKLFSDFFVVWKPRDIVGGDLYWSHKDDSGFLLAIIDCTGHGVPGALLTMTAAATLDHVVREINVTEPSEVLARLNSLMKSRLNQDNNAYTDDGMEIGIIRYDSINKSLKFSGSRIKLHIIDQGAMSEFKGDRQGIGYKRSDRDLHFTSYDVPLSKTAQYYMTTDGYIEQSGGEKRFGFGWSRYKTLLNAIFQLPMAEQKNEIISCFDHYRRKNEQRDDVLVFGFKI